MIDYYVHLPASDVVQEFDGHQYVYVLHRVNATGVTVCAPRMIRADRCTEADGIVRVWIGCMGDAIAQRTGLPMGVVAVERGTT